MLNFRVFKSNTKIIYCVIAIISAIGGIFFFLWKGSNNINKIDWEENDFNYIKVQRAKIEPIQIKVPLSGKIFVYSSTVLPSVEGIVSDISKKKTFKQDDSILTINDNNFSELEWKKSKVKKEMEKKKLQEKSALSKMKMASDLDVSLASLSKKYNSLEEKLYKTNKNKKTNITASSDGAQIGLMNVAPGSRVDPNMRSPITTIYHYGKGKIYVDVAINIKNQPGEYLDTYEEEGEIILSNNDKIKIIYDSQSVSATNPGNALMTRFKISDTNLTSQQRKMLINNANVEVILKSNEKVNQCSVPDIAVYNNDMQPVVKVVQDGIVYEIPVRIIEKTPKQVRVTGLSDNHLVIIEGQLKVRPGLKIKDSKILFDTEENVSEEDKVQINLQDIKEYLKESYYSKEI